MSVVAPDTADELVASLREVTDWLSGSQDYIDGKWEGKKMPLGTRYVQGKVRDAVARSRSILARYEKKGTGNG